MSENFEFFEGTRRESTAPQVTVRRSGQMVLTSAAVALVGDDATHVRFGYDRHGLRVDKAHIIGGGVSPADPSKRWSNRYLMLTGPSP
jgi:hypothetical protein